MQVKAKVLQVKTDEDGRLLAKIQLDKKLPKVGDTITCKWGKTRSNKQNAIYWLLLTWYIEHGGLKDQGYMFPEELHEALKGRLLSRIDSSRKFPTRVLGSTTELTTGELVEYMDKCEHIIQEYCGVSADGFWTEYAQNQGGGE